MLLTSTLHHHPLPLLPLLHHPHHSVSRHLPSFLPLLPPSSPSFLLLLLFPLFLSFIIDIVDIKSFPPFTRFPPSFLLCILEISLFFLMSPSSLLLYLFFHLSFCRYVMSVAIVPLAIEKGWGSETQGLILSSYWWGYVVTQIPGGILTAKYGAKVSPLPSSSFFSSSSSAVADAALQLPPPLFLLPLSPSLLFVLDTCSPFSFPLV